MSNESTRHLGTWLDELASAAPAPGGGAVGALSAAMGASLVSMVCNLTIGKPKYVQHEALMKEVLGQSEQLRRSALSLAEEDAAAFDAVIASYKLPKDDPERSSKIQAATVAAALVPLRTAELAQRIVSLAGRIVQGANKNVISDVAVAVMSARTAFDASAVNVEINLAAITDSAQKEQLANTLKQYAEGMAAVDVIVRQVREGIAK